MIIKYKGILIYSKIYKENDLFIKFLSNSDEIISGIVYGGLSKNKRNIFQIGFYLNIDVTTKSNKPPSINAELSEPYISHIINDKYKINCLMCVTTLINLSIIEGQKIKNIYKVVNKFLNIMFENKKWLIEYFIFLFNLLKIIGYEIDFLNDKKHKYFNLDTLEFNEIKTNSSIEFPYNLLEKKNNNLEISSINQIFKIFETVFNNHHLSNFNLHLPNQYHLFKKLIIDRIK